MSKRPSLFTLARKAVMFELRLYRSLFRWVTRRPYVPKSGVETFTYAQTVSMVMWLWIFASAVEVVVAHLLVPWPAARITLLMLGVWGLVWMVGFLASLKIYPHLLSDTGLRVRHGATVDISVPWEAISSLSVHRRDLPSTIRTLQPRETDRGTNLQVGVSGEVNVHAALREPTTVRTPKGDFDISELSFFADEPRPLVARASASGLREPRPDAASALASRIANCRGRASGARCRTPPAPQASPYVRSRVSRYNWQRR